MATTAAGSSTRAERELRRFRQVFLVVLGLLLVVPVLHLGEPAQDASVVLAGGALWPDNADAIYVDDKDGDVSRAYLDEFCRAYEERSDCAPEATPHTNPPALLPLTWLVGRLDIDVATFVLRLAAAIALVIAFELLWRTVRPDRATAPWLLLVVIAASPLAILTIELGQNTPYLFLAAVAGMAGVAGARVEPVATALATAFKGFPGLAVALVAVIERRFRRVVVLMTAMAVLLVIAVAVGGTGLIGDFVESGRARTEGSGYVHDTSLEAMIGRLGPDGMSVPVAWVLRAALAIPAVWLLRRCRTAEERWALAFLFVTFALPQVWPHYLLLVLPAYVAVGLSSFGRLDMRPLAAAGVGLATVGLLNNHAPELLPWAQPPTLLACAAALTWVWRRRSSQLMPAT